MPIIQNPEQRWYSVEEGLPTSQCAVQIMTDQGAVRFARISALSDCWLPMEQSIVLAAAEVTHWRPRALPPKVVKPDCRNYDKGDASCHGTAWALLETIPCEYGAEWCSYKAKSERRPDCKHYMHPTGGVAACAVEPWRPCRYDADYCKYEAKKETRPDCKHYAFDLIDKSVCTVRAHEPCQYGADGCKYEPKQTTRPDCRHLTHWGADLAAPTCAIAHRRWGVIEGCQYGADWCRYEAEAVADFEVALEKVHKAIGGIMGRIDDIHRRIDFTVQWLTELAGEMKDG